MARHRGILYLGGDLEMSPEGSVSPAVARVENTGDSFVYGNPSGNWVFVFYDA